MLYLLAYFHDRASLIHYSWEMWVTALSAGPRLFLTTGHVLWPLTTSSILLPANHALKIWLKISPPKNFLSSHACCGFGTGFNSVFFLTMPSFKTSPNLPSIFPSNLSALPRFADSSAFKSMSIPLRPFSSPPVSSKTRSILPGGHALRLPLFTVLPAWRLLFFERPYVCTGLFCQLWSSLPDNQALPQKGYPLPANWALSSGSSNVFASTSSTASSSGDSSVNWTSTVSSNWSFQ